MKYQEEKDRNKTKKAKLFRIRSQNIFKIMQARPQLWLSQDNKLMAGGKEQ